MKQDFTDDISKPGFLHTLTEDAALKNDNSNVECEDCKDVSTSVIHQDTEKILLTLTIIGEPQAYQMFLSQH